MQVVGGLHILRVLMFLHLGERRSGRARRSIGNAIKTGSFRCRCRT
jgi:hypothetical protein